MKTLIIHPENKKQLAALKGLFKAFNISVEEEKSPYDPEFVKMIQQGDKNIKAGKRIKVEFDD